MTTLSRIFLDEIERLLCDAAGVAGGSAAAGQARPRLGAVSFQHRFGSALNRHVHLHACVTDGVFERVEAAGDVRFHATRPLSPADLVVRPPLPGDHAGECLPSENPLSAEPSLLQLQPLGLSRGPTSGLTTAGPPLGLFHALQSSALPGL